MLYVGIDIAKNKHDCCILDSDGVVHFDNFQISNSSLGFSTLFANICNCLPQNDLKNVQIGLESTGIYGANLESFLFGKGISVVIFNPLATNLFRKAQTLRKTKTDKSDAIFLAKMLVSGDYKEHLPVSKQISEIKALTRHRHRLVSQQSVLKISINRILDIVFPEFADIVSSIHQKSSYALLLELPNTTAISTCHLTKLTNLLKSSSKGRYDKLKAIEIKQLATTSIGANSPAIALELQQTIRLICNIQAEIDIVDKHIKLAMTEVSSPIVTIPGIGNTLGAIIISEIGDISRFDTPAKLLAFAGLEPSTYQSGNFTATKTPMVKRGSTYLRWAILTATRLVAMRDVTFKAFLNKKRAEGKHYNVAISHAGKKLVRVIFHLLKTDTAFTSQSK